LLRLFDWAAQLFFLKLEGVTATSMAGSVSRSTTKELLKSQIISNNLK
jgi:hypothetical protein